MSGINRRSGARIEGIERQCVFSKTKLESKTAVFKLPDLPLHLTETQDAVNL